VLPPWDQRRLALTLDATDETATPYRSDRWTFADVDVVLLEGIFLFKRQLRPQYDLAARPAIAGGLTGSLPRRGRAAPADLLAPVLNQHHLRAPAL
jgi:hypothetical protein